MQMDNLVFLRGHLGADPEIRTLPSGRRVARLRLATNSRWRTAAGEPRERTDWHRIDAFGWLVDRCEPLKKGDKVQVMGSIRNDVVQRPDAPTRTFTTVVAQDVARVVFIRGSVRETQPIGDSQAAAPQAATADIPF